MSAPRRASGSSRSARATGCRTSRTPSRPRVKIALVERLAAAGLPAIEAGASSRPKWVPQMADSAEVLAGIRRRPGVRYPVLVPNVQGLDAALARRRRRDRRLRRRLGDLQPQEHQLLDRREPRALPPRRRARRWRAACASAATCRCVARLPLRGRRRAAEVAARRRAASTPSAATRSRSATRSASARPARRAAMLERSRPSVPLDAPRGPLPRHLRPGARQRPGLPRGGRRRSSTARSRAWAAAPTPRARPATSRPRTCSTCCDGLGVETGVELAAVVEAGAWISGVLGRENGSKVGRAMVGSESSRSPCLTGSTP